MTLLTYGDIHACDPAPHEMFDQQRIDFARNVEALTIAKSGAQEPVAVFRSDENCGHVELLAHRGEPLKDGDKLFAAPVQQGCIPKGWSVNIFPDGFIGIHAPEPKEGESRRTNCGIHTTDNSDLADIMRKYFSHAVSAPVQQEPIGWKHDCAALLTNDIELWIDRCPHCGKPRPAPVQQEPCQHSIADIRNPVVTSGYMCVKCGALFSAADHSAPVQQEPVAWIPVSESLPKAMRGVSYGQSITDVVLVRHSDRPDYPITAHACVGKNLGAGIAIPTNGASEHPEIAWYSASAELNNPFNLKNDDYGRFLPKIFGSKITHWKPIGAAPVQQEPIGWKHDCVALLTNDIELWIDRCPHCGKPRPAPVQQEPVQITDSMAYAFQRATTDGSLTRDEVDEIKRGLKAAFADIAAPMQHDTNKLLADKKKLERLLTTSSNSARILRIRIVELEAQNKALLGALKWLDRWMGAKQLLECANKVRAAIAAVEKQT